MDRRDAALSAMAAAAKSNVARALAIVGVIALALGLVLSIPRANAASKRAALAVALVDVSKSVVARSVGEWERSTSAALRAWARRAEASGHDVSVLAFGRDVRAVLSPRSARVLVEALESGQFEPSRELLEKNALRGALETRLAAALNLARTLARDRPSSSITIFGDGTFTGADPLPVAHELASTGCAIQVQTEPPRAWNFALSPLEVPRELEVGAPIVVSALLRIDRGTLARENVHVDFELFDGLRREKRVDIEAGTSELVPLHVDFGPARAGLVYIGARVSPPDAIREDDSRAAVLRCGGSLVVGMLDAPIDSSAPELTVDGVDLIRIGRDELARELVHLDALISFSARATLTEQRSIRNFVEHGGGWLDLADGEWIRARSDPAAPLRELAALVPDQVKRERDVIFLIDASGSMAGPAFDAVRAQIGGLVDSALPNDDVSVRFFAGDLYPAIRFGMAAERGDPERRTALDDAVRTARSPTGPTRILSALETLARERSGVNRDALVLLLSDGRDPETSDRESRLTALKLARGPARMRVVAVAPVADVDREFLVSLADSFEDLADPTQWPHIFRGEILEQELVRRENMPVLPVSGGPEPAASLAAATQNLPSIDEAVRAGVAPGAQLLWTDDRGTPLAAVARRGAGLVVTIGFSPRFGGTRNGRRASALAPIVRALARHERPEQPHLRLEENRIVLENVAANFPAVAHARAEVDEGDVFDFEMVVEARGFDALTARSSPIPDAFDAHSGFASVHIDGGAAGDLDLSLEIPRAAEFAFEKRRFVAPRPSAPVERVPRAESTHTLAPWSLALGVLALTTAALLGAFSGRNR
ncbi:MAG: VWA domain-containing protein [Planctomycetota bacterium]|nr:VWA domain-containing protein [Planctomycetota bacterium]